MISGVAAVWKGLPPAQRRMIVMLAGAILIAQVNQPFPELAPLQHGPTLVLLIAAPSLLKRWPLSTGAVACIFLFLLLHTLGGRYIYSCVPYDAWARWLTGHDLSGRFGWERNGYDRLVHFAFGLLLTLPIIELASARGNLRSRWAMTFAFAGVGFVGAIYEIFEWLLTIVAESETADWYNGQQGDVWDAQKDLAAAQVGALMTLMLVAMKKARQAGADTISATLRQPEE